MMQPPSPRFTISRAAAWLHKAWWQDRDGFQMEPEFVPTDAKIALIALFGYDDILREAPGVVLARFAAGGEALAVLREQHGATAGGEQHTVA